MNLKKKIIIDNQLALFTQPPPISQIKKELCDDDIHYNPSNDPANDEGGPYNRARPENWDAIDPYYGNEPFRENNFAA